ncbi:addiction module protein [Phenylobacterium montanum]|uniref:Addiction module protein n=1 Tax=Phenylobacterium montanum TaxID=2823693 RepID=A0A975FZJ1_9CAUL|nr:addiction module protein [Caulobacter sp. S6]QUD87802.1 addiction module protein [Caulobacter sp. S6]
MATLDFSNLTTQERLDLIEALWDSLDAEAAPLTDAQAEEVRRRLHTLDEDIEHGRDASELLADLRRRHG